MGELDVALDEIFANEQISQEVSTLFLRFILTELAQPLLALDN